MKFSRRALAITATMFAILFLMSMISAGKSNIPVSGTYTSSPLKDPVDMPVVLIDNSHENSHNTFYEMFAGTDEKWSSNLTEWGFEVRFLEDSLSAADLADVDIFIAGFYYGSETYTPSELAAITAWFNEGNKSLWISGDSDFGDDNGYAAGISNSILQKLGSHAMIEKCSVESDDNMYADYRVKASVYNTIDEIPAQLLSTAKHGGAEFHGPAPIVGYNYSSGNLVALESPAADAYFKARNLYWVVKATNNDTHKSTIVYGTPATNWTLHTNNAQDSFVMMTAQELGPDNSCKIVVTGEAPYTSYKAMFNDPGEHGVPQDQYYIVKEVIHWFATPGYEATCQAHIIAPKDGSTTIEPEITIEGIAKGDTIASLEVYIDGTLETTLQKPYAIVHLVEDLGLGAGTYNLTIVATSGEGIVSTPDTAVFTLDIEEEKDKDTPGFEILTIGLALSLSSLVLKRKRN
ncbi:MAG: Ig-like domain-containing protein [Candidatus Thorarchaeota archaeon]